MDDADLEEGEIADDDEEVTPQQPEAAKPEKEDKPVGEPKKEDVKPPPSTDNVSKRAASPEKRRDKDKRSNSNSNSRPRKRTIDDDHPPSHVNQN